VFAGLRHVGGFECTHPQSSVGDEAGLYLLELVCSLLQPGGHKLIGALRSLAPKDLCVVLPDDLISLIASSLDDSVAHRYPIVVSCDVAFGCLQGGHGGLLGVALHTRRCLLLSNDDGRLLRCLLLMQVSLLLVHRLRALDSTDLGHVLQMGLRVRGGHVRDLWKFRDFRNGSDDLFHARLLSWLCLVRLCWSSC